MLASCLLLTLLIVASFTDLRWHKIYNWTTYPGMLAALAINLAGTLAVSYASPAVASRWQAWIGWIPDVAQPLVACLLGWLVCGFFMLVCLVMFQIGGGDVKLIAMIGAFLGLEQGLVTMLWMLILGGAVGLMILIWQLGVWQLVARSGRQAGRILRLGSHAKVPEEDKARLRQPLYLAPTSLPAVLIVRLGLLDGII